MKIQRLEPGFEMATMNDLLGKKKLQSPMDNDLDPFFQDRRCICVDSDEGIESVAQQALNSRCDYLIVTKGNQPIKAFAIHEFLALYATVSSMIGF